MPVDVRGWERISAVADVVVESCSLVGVKPDIDAAIGTPKHLLASAIHVALTARTIDVDDAAAVAACCFDKVTAPYRHLVTIGGYRPESFLPLLLVDALLAMGWLARVAAAMAGGDGAMADEAGRNCMDACVRLHVFTGLPGSRVERSYREQLAIRRKGTIA